MEGDGEMAADESMTDGQMEQDGTMEPTDPTQPDRIAVDRFSQAAGTLFVRENMAGLPAPDEPIDFDEQFLTTGFGPGGEVVKYYNFDVQPTAPAPIYVPVREDDGMPVDGQLNIVGVVPGDDGYNDFWRVHHVTVPSDYEANTLTSVSAIEAGEYDVTPTETLVNCPIVPAKSSAMLRYQDGQTGLVDGWYDNKVVSYFVFAESPLAPANGTVPVSPIYVSFNTNPGEDGGGPASGFMTEAGSDQTHNVVATLPAQDAYSPLWSVSAYDNDDFESVTDRESAENASILRDDMATVNCPIVAVDAAMDGNGAMTDNGAAGMMGQ